MSAPFYSNVFFLCTARMAGQAIIVASYSYNTETELGAVKQVLEQPTINLSPGKHYSFNAGEVSWHLISDDQNLIYVLICNTKYPQRCAHMCLEELQRTFVSKVGDKASTAKDRSLDKQCSGLMQKICQKYDNLAEVDKLASVARKVDTVKLVMQENVDAALQNCVKLESIEKAAEELQQQAGVFKRNANELKNKMWWKNMKMRLIIAAIVLVILGVIIAIAVTVSGGGK
mmetsp:Transcript_11716/g.20631  ORF Transcript_11716/g.20631 Transcript_11716/m.20631 type:complete len:230 (-) Transcript_11716:224-913(-)|eukprot:CAMPEP_0184974690 /NCGR_PEP_ID=MMETSP1098-20130426/6102_1 /TAXON_ID=89044 /ORGANISM="Spumella elongata, Strain CCAP 955/1" /LENGTH=229 /DNA_ID=CAMNT_0027497305 /DNA_START=61 /DNA_END=750 /DNA_ORIENTATION=+